MPQLIDYQIGDTSKNQLLAYPGDLGSARVLHYMVFYIRAQATSKYIDQNLPTALGITGSAGATASEPENELTTKEIKTPSIRTGAAIALYMPANLQWQYAAEYETQESKVGRVLGDDAEAAGSTGSEKLIGAGAPLLERLASDNVKNAATQLSKTAINPHNEQIFRGVPFRGFTFDYEFVPKTPQEAQTIDQIVRTFRFHMMPELRKTGGGRYFLFPSEFDIVFYRGGSVNHAFPKITSCVLTQCNYSVGEGGYAAFVDGMPVTSKLSLQFTEIEIITKERILEGY